MSSNKDPKDILTGAGQAGSKSVGAESLTFPVPDGPKTTLWLENLFADVAEIANITIGDVTSDTITVRVATVTEEITAPLGTIDTLGATDFTVSTVTASTSVEAPTLRATTQVETNTIAPATGGTVTVTAPQLATTQITSTGNVDVGGRLIAADVDVEGTVSTDFLSSNNGTVVSSSSDIVGSGSLAGSRLSLTATSAQRFPNLTEAFEGLEVGAVGIVESYDNTKEIGDEDWTLATSSDLTAMASDGVFSYLLWGDGIAQRVDRETGSTETTYTFTSTFDSTENFLVATNGSFVAFGFGSVIEIFEVDDGATPVFVKTPANPVKDLWMNHEAVFSIAGSNLTRTELVDGTDNTVLSSANNTNLTGYGDYLILGQSGATGHLRLLDAETLNIIGSPLTVDPPVDIVTDGSYVYVTSDPGGTFGEIAVLPLTLSGFQDSKVIWQEETGQSNTRLSADHRHLYTVDNTAIIQVFDKKTFQKLHSFDIFSTLFGLLGVTEILSDGQSVFVSATTADGPAMIKIHLDQDPTLFMRVAPAHPRGKLFYHHLIPIQGEDGALSRINGTQKLSRPVNLFRHESRTEAVGDPREWGLDPAANRIEVSEFDTNDSLVLTYENVHEGTLDSLGVTAAQDSGFNEDLNLVVHIRNPITSTTRTATLTINILGNGAFTAFTETIEESLAPSEYVIIEIVSPAPTYTNLRLEDLYLNLTVKE